MTSSQVTQEQLETKDRVACTDCKTPNMIESKKLSETRLIRFIGVTDAESNRHRFPHQVMDQMVGDAKDRYILPFMPTSVKEIDEDTLNVLVETKDFGFKGNPIPLRDMHITDAQRTKVGRVLRIDVKHKPDAKNSGSGRKWMEVVAEVFDPHTVRLIDRGMVSKFSIGFKHKYDVVDGVKVSTYGEIDHFGIVDVPADPEAVLLEQKEREETKMPGMSDCVQAKVAEGMSQEEAAQACGESAAKADAFTPGGEPKAGESRAFNDCVQGLVATGLDQDEAERACRDKSGDHHDSDIARTTPDKSHPSGEPSMKELMNEFKSFKTRTETEVKAQRELIQTLSAENKRLSTENKEKQIAAEIKLLMDQGRVVPATKDKVFAMAMALPDAKTRDTYYDTLGQRVDFDDKSHHEQGEETNEKALDSAAEQMWGTDIKGIVEDIKGRRSW